MSTAEFTMWFAFDSGGVVQADNAIELVGAEGKAASYDPQTREGAWAFHKIVGRNVLGVSRPDDWTIEITFENGFRLITRSEDGPYESGRIAMPGREPQNDHRF